MRMRGNESERNKGKDSRLRRKEQRKKGKATRAPPQTQWEEGEKDKNLHEHHHKHHKRRSRGQKVTRALPQTPQKGYNKDTTTNRENNSRRGRKRTGGKQLLRRGKDHCLDITTIITTALLTVLHHDGQELHNHLGARPDQDLPLAPLLCVVDAPQSVCQRVHPHHLALLLQAGVLVVEG